MDPIGIYFNSQIRRDAPVEFSPWIAIESADACRTISLQMRKFSVAQGGLNFTRLHLFIVV